MWHCKGNVEEFSNFPTSKLFNTGFHFLTMSSWVKGAGEVGMRVTCVCVFAV